MADLSNQLEPNLCLASNGMRLAENVIAMLMAAPVVHIDFAHVRRMTPSFANAFVMTLMARFSVEELRTRMLMENRNENVLRAMGESARRYLDGVRLSSQRIPCEPPLAEYALPS